MEFGVTGISREPEIPETAEVVGVTRVFGESGLVMSLTRPTYESAL